MLGCKQGFLLTIVVLANLTQSVSVAGQEVVEVVSIGGHGGGEWFHRVGDVRSSADGRIYVADSGLCKVFIYSAEGSYIGAFGGRGTGPAEFQDIAAIRVDSVLTVWDARWHRSARFSLEGAHLDTKAQSRDSWPGFGTTRELRYGYVLSELFPVMTIQWLHMRPKGVEVGRSALVPVDVRAVSDSDLAEIERQIRAESSDGTPRRIQLRGPSLWSGITRLVADESSRLIYIGTPVREGPLQWRVLHPDDAVTPLILPERFDLKSVRGDMLYGVVEDEFDIPRVQVLRIPG